MILFQIASVHRFEMLSFLEAHGVPFALCTGFAMVIAGYAAGHWLKRRRFYRRRLADPFPSYFGFWITRLAEGWLGLLAVFSKVAGFLLCVAGIIDFIDG